MNISEIDENSQRFLVELCEQTNGDPSVKTSMYEIGESMGFERDVSAQVGETLIGWGLVEIKTLTGGIGITDDGVTEARKLGARLDSAEENEPKLGDAPIIEELVRKAVEKVADELKGQAGKIGLDFEDLNELMADLKTIDVQLSSSRPKTAIVRECFHSIKDVLVKGESGDSLLQVKGLLGE
jgi:hypothetical protein